MRSQFGHQYRNKADDVRTGSRDHDDTGRYALELPALSDDEDPNDGKDRINAVGEF